MNHICSKLNVPFSYLQKGNRTWRSMRHLDKRKFLTNICRMTLQKIYRLQTLLIRYGWTVKKIPEIKWLYKLNSITQWMWCSLPYVANFPKNENPLNFWGYVLNFPEDFAYFLARPFMCSIWICSQATYSQSLFISWESAKQRGMGKPSSHTSSLGFVQSSRFCVITCC